MDLSKKQVIEEADYATISDIQYMLRKWEFSAQVINKIEAILHDNALELNPWLNDDEPDVFKLKEEE